MASSISLGIVIGATMAGSVGSAFGNVSRQAQQLGERLNNIRLARTAGQDVQRLGTELAALRARAAAAGGASGTLAAEINRVETELRQAEAAANRYGLELTDLAGETARLQQAEARLQRQLNRRNQLDTNRNRRGELMGEAMGVMALGAAFALPIKQAIEFESVMADVGKVVDSTKAELDGMGNALLKMSTSIPMSAKGLGEIMAAAGQAGIAKNELLQFTSDAAKMGVAFDMSGAEAGAAMTGLRSIFHLGQKDVVALGDAFNYLSNNMDARARDIVNISNRTGSMANLFGLSGQQLGALSATFLALKTPPEVAATGINALLLKMATADKQSDKFQDALKSMGMSASGLKKSIKEDAQGTLIKFLETVKKSPDVMGTLSDLFGAEYSDDIAKLVGSLDTYKQALGMVGNNANFAGSMQKEYEVRSKTTANALEILKNRGNELAINIGTILLPSIVNAAESIGGLVSNITALTQAHPEATSKIIGAVGALIGFKVASLAARFGMTLLSDAVVFGKAVFDFFSLSTMQANIAIMRHRAALLGVAIQSRAMAAGTAIATAAQWLFNAAITANPLGLLIIGIAAVAFAVVKYWEPIKAFATGLWDGLKMGLAPVLEALAPLQPIFSGIASAIGSLFTWLGQLFTPLNYSKEELSSFAQAGQQMGMILGSAIMALIQVTVTLAQTFIAVGTAIGQGVAMGVSYFQQLHSAAVGLVAGFFEIGSNIMTGLLNGLSAGYARVKAKVSEMANSIKSSFQSVLGIHSPSRVFAGYGENINEGLSIGMTASQHKPIGKAVQVADMMARGFEVNNPTPTFPVSNQTNNSNSVSSPLSVTINVYQQAGENAEELANRISSIIQHNQEIKQRGSLYD